MYLARGGQSVGMHFHAEVSLMVGIEEPYQTADLRRYAVRYVPPAATWILLAGETIYGLCKSDPKSVPKDEWVWGKSPGYSVGRWALWKKRFGELAIREGLEDRVKDLAARAVSEMDRIEGHF